MEAAISKVKKASTTNLASAYRALIRKSLVKPVTTQALNRDLPIDQA